MAEADRELAGSMLSSCVAGRTRLLNRMISSIYDTALRPFGLRNGQLTMLCVVCYMQQVKPGELEKALQMDPSTISRNIKRMKSKGWLRTVPGKDERSHLIELRPEGLDLIRKASPAWHEAQLKAQQLLGDEAAQSIASVANQLLQPVLDEIPSPRVPHATPRRER